jgi:hypothetical protein
MLALAATPARSEPPQPGAEAVTEDQERRSPCVDSPSPSIVITLRGGQAPGQGRRTEGTMPHDKIKAAARKRMAQTGEPYATARRAVIREHKAAAGQTRAAGAQWFAISYSQAGLDKITAWLDTLLFRAGPGVSGVEVDPGEIRIRMGSFKLDIPRSSIRSVKRSPAKVRGTTGVHGGRGRWLVNGSADGLVELAIEPPSYLAPGIDTLFRKQKVNLLIVSLTDPDAFIAALEPGANA